MNAADLNTENSLHAHKGLALPQAESTLLSLGELGFLRRSSWEEGRMIVVKPDGDNWQEISDTKYFTRPELTNEDMQAVDWQVIH